MRLQWATVFRVCMLKRCSAVSHKRVRTSLPATARPTGRLVCRRTARRPGSCTPASEKPPWRARKNVRRVAQKAFRVFIASPASTKTMRARPCSANVKRTANIPRITWDEAWHLMERAVMRGRTGPSRRHGPSSSPYWLEPVMDRILRVFPDCLERRLGRGHGRLGDCPILVTLHQEIDEMLHLGGPRHREQSASRPAFPSAWTASSSSFGGGPWPPAPYSSRRA